MRIGLDTILLWHTLVLIEALLLGIEAPALTFVVQYKRRPWYEQALAASPAGGFCWMVLLGRGMRDTYDYWHSYLVFQLAHYPPPYAQPTAEDISDAVAEVVRQGWEASTVALLLLALGGVLLLWWLRPHARAAAHATRFVADGDGTLEITIEPIAGEPTQAESKGESKVDAPCAVESTRRHTS